MSFLINFTLLSIIAAFTPGPNNSMLMQSGMIFGLRNTLRHIMGVVVGFNFLFFCINLGIYSLLTRYPVIDIVIKVIGSLYFAYLAHRMITLKRPQNKEGEDVPESSKSKPLGFWGAFLFQWVNVKAWFFAFSSIGSLPASRSISQAIVIQIIITITTISSAVTWAYGGVLVSRAFKKPVYFRVINIILASFLIYIGIGQWF